MTKGPIIIQWVREKKQWILGIAVIIGIATYYYMNLSDDVELSNNGQSFDETAAEQQQSAADQADDDIKADTNTSMAEPIKVDIKGAIKKPGVYTASSHDRIIDLIERAGGLAEDADVAKVNLSQKVADEMVIYVPKVGEEIPATESAPVNVAQQNEKGDGKININSADATMLDSLPGIGPSKAEAIIEYRETNGPFQKVEDLMNISGIGEKTFEKLKEQVTVQ